MIQSPRTLLATLLASALGGCATVDNFSSRATEFNVQAERTQNEVLLLNIVRSSMRRPREFTALQTVSGTASASGGLTLAVPFGRNNGANSLGLTSSMSGGPTFSVSVLDTQEFYQGIMKPLPMSTVDFYVQQRYPAPLILNMFLGSIVIRQNGQALEIVNYVSDDDELSRFQLLVNYLVNLGLTTEQNKLPASGYGPLRTAEEVKVLDEVSKAATASLDVEQVGWCQLKPEDWHSLNERKKIKLQLAQKIAAACKDDKEVTHEKLLEKVPELPHPFYRVQKAGSGAKAQFCFGAPLAAEQGATAAYFDTTMPFATFVGGLASSKAACAHRKTKATGTPPKLKSSVKLPKSLLELFSEPVMVGEGTGFAGFRIPKKLGHRLAEGASATIDFGSKVSLEFVPRSTEGVIYYLGEVARRGIDADYDKDEIVVSVPSSPPRKEVPLGTCQTKVSAYPAKECDAVFRLVRDDTAQAFVTVVYDGSRYAVPRDQRLSGRTTTAMNIVTQLIALNRSAKDAPATSVFNVINP